MEKIQNPKHPSEALLYNLSRMFERASYYGFRALAILYMTGEVIKMDRSEALVIYTWFTGSVVFSQVLGALVGDLLVGNKKTIIIGGIIQAMGVFTLCIPSVYGIYFGLFLVVLGNGFFTPNIISNYGKLYLNNTKLLDAGFTIFYLTINIASFLGVLIIGYLGAEIGYRIGFILCGLLTLLSLVPILKTKKIEELEIDNTTFSLNKRALSIVIAFIVVGLFWSIYEIANIGVFNLQINLIETLSIDIPVSISQSLNFVFIFPISILAIIAWTFLYNSQFFKLFLGFVFGAFAFGILLLIPETPGEVDMIYFLVALLFLAISEIHVAPIIHSILTKYSNPKYLAILISLAFLPIKVLALIFGLFNDGIYDHPTLALKFGFITMIVIGIGMFVYVFMDKRNTPIRKQ